MPCNFGGNFFFRDNLAKILSVQSLPRFTSLKESLQFTLCKGIDGIGGPENGNFPLLYVIKMSLRRGWVVLKSLKTPF